MCSGVTKPASDINGIPHLNQVDFVFVGRDQIQILSKIRGLKNPTAPC